MNIKILATNRFEGKLKSLAQVYKDAFFQLLNAIKNLDGQSVSNYLGVNFTFNSVQFYKIGNLRIFLNFVEDDKKNITLVFLDLTFNISPININTSRNPRYNNLINPRYNNLINPRYNNLINPRYNNLINPRYNNLINPRYNNLINPRYNNLINPRYNNLINPRYNNLINPRYNNLINPRYNPSFNGYYNFDLNGVSFEFVIKEDNQDTLLFFDFSGEQTKYAVKHAQNGYVVFNLNGEWIGHIESDSRNGFNYFDLNGEWIGFLK